MYDLSDIRGIDLPTAWYARYMSLVPGRDSKSSYGFYFDNADSPLLRVLNVKYYITAETNEVPGACRVWSAANSGGVSLWRLNHVQPRSFMVYEAVVAATDNDTADCLLSEPERVYDRVVLMRQKGAQPLCRDRLAAPSARVDLQTYQINRAIWQVTTSHEGYLVTTDAYYPGWEAYVDGQRVELYRANIAFRSVFLPAGTHIVEYRFKPRSLMLGACLALCGVAGWVGLLFIGALIQKRSSCRPLGAS